MLCIHILVTIIPFKGLGDQVLDEIGPNGDSKMARLEETNIVGLNHPLGNVIFKHT